MLKTKAYLIFLITSVFLAIKVDSSGNLTIDDNDDEDFGDMNIEEFKNTVKRYRRLIPYMSAFVANNYVNNNQGDNYERDEQLPQPEMLIQQPRRFIKQRPGNNIRNNQRINTIVKQERFVPSIQYDPKDAGSDNDYFRPVQYNTKINNYDDYYHDYERRQNYPEITTQNIQESRYYPKEQAQRIQITQNPLAYERDYQKQKPSPPSDYLIDYIPRPKQQQPPLAQDYYQVEDYEPIRYVKIEPPRSSSVYSHPQRLIPQQQSSHKKIYPQRNPPIANENIVKSLQLTNKLPEMLSRDNIDSSIKTLVEILGLLHGKKSDIQHELNLNIPTKFNYEEFKEQYMRPKVVTETRYQATQRPQTTIVEDDIRLKQVPYINNNQNEKSKISSSYSIYKSQQQNPDIIEYYTPTIQDINENEQVNYDNYDNNQNDNIYNNPPRPETIVNHNDDDVVVVDNEQQDINNGKIPDKFFNIDDKLNIPTMAIKYGATRGKPFVDYPAYSTIPKTNFHCKKQRYKGFFGDPDSGCQAWHYCDLNGGKSSFLCPNGTIFSQAALTCDWWFNVKCESTKQLYVLNERLYKFILPVMPKFPEDFTGPEVDRYLEEKFKEMEEKMKEKKLKKAMEKKTKEKVQSNSSE